MKKKPTSIDTLNDHLFEAIEGLKNNSDPKADACEKMDIETAKTIAEIGKVVLDGYKVKSQVLSMYARADNPNGLKNALIQSGFISDVKELPENI